MNSLNRWLILTQYYPPEIGAPQIRLSMMARILSQHGIEVEVLTAMPNYPAGKTFSGYQGRWYMREEIDGISVRRTWIFAGTGKSIRIRLTNYLSFTFTALLAALVGSRPDVLFIESQPLSLGLVGILMKWLRGVPYIYNVPDLQIDEARDIGFISNEKFLRFALAIENFFMHQSWKVSTVTHRYIEHFQSRGLPLSQITFLPNGADTEFLKPQSPSQDMLDRWGLHDKTVFLYVGTHAYYQGLDTLIEAATLIRDQSDIVILMIGRGPERARLKQEALDHGLTNVIFAQSPYEEMDQLYSITYASISMLRNVELAKNMRLSKVFPSLSCGVPVIYSGFGEGADLLNENRCGYVIQPERPDLLAQAITRLAQDPSAREQMGQFGRMLVESEYSWKFIVERWLNEIVDHSS